MRLARLEIQILPGIEPGFSLDSIAPGTNVITGPNAIGKSSLIRALGYLLASSQDDPGALTLTAVFDSNESRWTVRRSGSEIVWERDGRPVTRPALPERDQLICHWLSMEDLLKADERDKRLVAELRRIMSGGFDLKALRQESPFKVGRRSGNNEATRLLESEKKLHLVEGDYKQLRKLETDIPGLESSISDARKAGDKAKDLKNALSLLEIINEREQIEAVLAEFPDNMEKLHGNELDRIESLQKKSHDHMTEITIQKNTLDEAQQKLEETGLAENRPQKNKIDLHIKKLNAAIRKIDQREQIQSDYLKISIAEKQSRKALGDYDNLPKFDPNSVSEAEKLARDIHSKELKKQGLESQLDAIDELPDKANIDLFIQAGAALRKWLGVKRSISSRIWIAFFLALGGGLLTLISSFLAAVWLAFIGGVLSLGCFTWALVTSYRNGIKTARQAFEQTGLEPPESWELEAVRTHLRKIDVRRAGLQEEAVRANKAKEIQKRLDRIKRELQTLIRQKKPLADRLGFDPEITASALDRFIRLVRDYDEAHRELEVTQVNIEQLDFEISELKESIWSFLEHWQVVQVDKSIEGLEISLEEIRGRFEQAETAERTKREAEQSLSRLKEVLKSTKEEESSLYRDIGLEPGQHLELKQRIGKLEEWCKQRNYFDTVSVREASQRSSLDGHKFLLQRVEEKDQVGIKEDLSRFQKQADDLEELQEELTKTRTRLSDAGKDLKLEKTLSNVEVNRRALEDKFCEAQFAEMAQFLLNDIDEEYQSEHEPVVLRDAREYFKQFTHHAFDLELDEHEGFIARDLQQQARRSLSELSSATRMQLLLATRVAWIRRVEERRESVPIFLDEALSTSDHERFTKIAQSLESLAQEEDRQIFYLSSRLHELALWERATGIRPNHIDLARVRFEHPDTNPEDYKLPETEPIPIPEDYRPEEYAALLRVPPVDPRLSEGMLHLFYILRDDLSLLYKLMENWRISTLGQFENFLTSRAVNAVIESPDRQKNLQERCSAVRVWIAAWRIGRGRSVDRIALEHSNAVSEKYMDLVAQLADKLSGDGAAMIEALREGQIHNYRTVKINELEEWLEKKGYIDNTAPLCSDERLQRTLLHTASSLIPEDVSDIVSWLEAGSCHDI